MTTQAKHTPGPWEIGSINKRDENLWWSAVFTPKSAGKFHTPRAGEALGVDREECEGNARLIASAPDLLAALSRLAVWTDHLGPCFCQACDYMPGNPERHKHAEECDIARAAIAKAEGRAGE